MIRLPPGWAHWLPQGHEVQDGAARLEQHGRLAGQHVAFHADQLTVFP